MELRTQLAIVAAVAVAWSAGRFVRVRSVLDPSHVAERLSLAALEARVARSPADTLSTRVLLRRYFDQGMPRLVVDSARRAPAAVQRDGAVCLVVARANEALGDVRAAQAVVNGAMSRCSVLPESLAEGAGCDFRTVAELSMELVALDRMVEWNITPQSDPARASLAHELSTRPVRMSARAVKR
jgi:hypothetical protein